MLIGRSNMAIAKLVSSGTGTPETECLFIEEDGTTVACDRFAAVACSPYNQDAYFPEIGVEQTNPPAGGVSVRLDIVDQALRNMPKGSKNVSIQAAALTQCDSRRVGLTTASKSREQTIAGQTISYPYPPWKRVFSTAWAMITATKPPRRVALNRHRLIQMLQVMDEATGDKSDEAILLVDFAGEDEPIVMRAYNYDTSQTIVGVMRTVSLDAEAWPKLGRWERALLGAKKLLRKKNLAI